MRWSATAWLALAFAFALGASAESVKPGTSLYTNSVTYCAEAKAVLVDDFDIAYWKENNSVTFSFAFASVEPNLNVRANLFLNAYGMVIFNETINICDLVSGVLCPLPMINFTGYGTYPLPESIQEQVPGIAWSVPNLEAYARVELWNQATNETAACLQATLSNGWSTKYKGVMWGTGMFTLVAVLAMLVHSLFLNSPSPVIYRWFDILFLYQSTAASGLLHLNYPLAYSNFVQNFRWSLGLFFSESMQRSISRMRNKTGGHMDDTAYSASQYINRKLSPYNILTAVNVTDPVSTPEKFRTFITDYSADYAQKHVKRIQIPSTVSQNASNDLTTGIPVYVNTAGIPQANAYDTIFFFFLAVLGMVLVVHALLGLFTLFLKCGTSNRKGRSWSDRFQRSWFDQLMANLLRLALAFALPISIFAFYQFILGRRDSGLSIFFAVLGLIVVFVPLIAAFVWQILKRRNPESGVSKRYTDFHVFHSIGAALYRQYNERNHLFWFIPILFASVLRAAFIGFGQRSGWAQVIGSLVAEFIVFIALLVRRPHKTRGSDWLSPILSFFRLALAGLMVCFLESIKLKAIPRTIVGIVCIALVGIPTVILLLSLIWNIGYGWLWRRNTERTVDGADLEHRLSRGDYRDDASQVGFQEDPKLNGGAPVERFHTPHSHDGASTTVDYTDKTPNEAHIKPVEFNEKASPTEQRPPVLH
ncbi:hypothetical protein Q8F55_000523 [Vanrija albida]|uniref:ML-like domain-containing protein n=1 Tax=Vanrija albida TaxID=181172 RepID=A0ABR3QDP1_9TREE